jgi:hypothetical protein
MPTAPSVDEQVLLEGFSVLLADAAEFDAHLAEGDTTDCDSRMGRRLSRDPGVRSPHKAACRLGLQQALHN